MTPITPFAPIEEATARDSTNRAAPFEHHRVTTRFGPPRWRAGAPRRHPAPSHRR